MLEKNKNIQAQGLEHYLNATKDTLILRSQKKINALYTINNDYGREFDLYVNSKSYHFPLNKLSKGRHVMVVVQSPMRIVFVVHIYGHRENKSIGIQTDTKSSETMGLATIEND